ncbi:hypothetical protein mRhiFer1_008465 [Rhinolophus ferrumequinum]|uniref:non-specific serine/threonine protein kinase n=1 Tax=Rhinolophus ferrumequinum TaxID=59479 RepID=A0A7J7V8I7_RHIFE|nr:hypothetical protein mRhiFer1_008465 [Rhinolophus ferrumequinum]
MPFNGSKLSTFCGSPVYSAPELFQGKEYDSPPVDIWSLGVLLYHVVTGTIPFMGTHLRQLVKQILKGNYTVLLDLTIELHIPLSKLITVNPKERSTLTEIMPDPWLDKGHVEELPPFTESPSDDLDSVWHRIWSTWASSGTRVRTL